MEVTVDGTMVKAVRLGWTDMSRDIEEERDRIEREIQELEQNLEGAPLHLDLLSTDTSSGNFYWNVMLSAGVGLRVHPPSTSASEMSGTKLSLGLLFVCPAVDRTVKIYR